MKFIQRKPRNQWELYCPDVHADAGNEVRWSRNFCAPFLWYA